MAKEWYLLTTPYDQVSGYESDAYDDFAQEGFLESLGSEIATTVELCNYDLSERTTIKAVIQNNHQDKKLKTRSRAMLVPVGTCHSGMYVKYKDRYWLIVGLVDDNTVYVISPTADKLVKLGIEGSVLSYVSKVDGNANLTQDATFNKSWDAQVITSAIAGSITVA